jgi:hypothetical protein
MRNLLNQNNWKIAGPHVSFLTNLFSNETISDKIFLTIRFINVLKYRIRYCGISLNLEFSRFLDSKLSNIRV